MDVKAKCPKCGEESVITLRDDECTIDLTCDKCGCEYTLDNSKPECEWQAHGEPRSTVLSAIANRSNKSMMAVGFLVVMGILGILNAGIYLWPDHIEIGVMVELLQGMDLSPLAAVMFIGSLAAFIAAFFTYMGRYFRYTMLLTMISMSAIGFFFGWILSVVALWLIMDVKSEFSDGEKFRLF